MMTSVQNPTMQDMFAMFAKKEIKVPVESRPPCDCTDPYYIVDACEGYTVCDKCGLVVENYMIDESPEWINGEDGKDKSRCGPPMNHLLPDSSLSTMMCVPYHLRAKFGLMKRIHEQGGMEYKERSLYHIFKDIEETMTMKMGLPKSIVERAKELYKDVKSKRLSRGEVHKALIACCVYYACKIENMAGVTRSRKEIIGFFEVDDKHFNDAIKITRDILKDKSFFHLIEAEIKPSDMILRNIAWLPVDNRKKWSIVNKIKTLEDDMNKIEFLSGKQTKSILAGILYYVCVQEKVNMTIDDVVSNLKVSQGTVLSISKSVERFVSISKS